jgi:hypothetical protein
MLRISLISKYVFQVFEDFAVALYFRKYYLADIFRQLKPRPPSTYTFSYYKSVVLDHSEQIFLLMRNGGKSRHLRDLGRILTGNMVGFSNLKHDISSIDMHNSLSQSGLVDTSYLNQSGSKLLNASLLNASKIEEEVSLVEMELEAEREKPKLKPELNINLNVLTALKVEDILRALTSKIYKHQKVSNY